MRRRMLDSLAEMNQLELEKLGDPETRTRIAQYEMAFRMQSFRAGTDRHQQEPEAAPGSCTATCTRPGSFARCCLMARRLAERDVRFVQVYHRGWDVHGDLPATCLRQCKDIDQAAWALVRISNSAACWTTRW